MRRHALSLIIGGLMLTAPAGLALEQPAVPSASLEDLEFLTGRWVDTASNGTYVEESWCPPKNDAMIGCCRFVKDGKATIYEFLVIKKGENGKPVLNLKHYDDNLVGWEPHNESVTCPLTTCEPNQAVFENANSKHLVRISYNRVDAKHMDVTIERTRNGKKSFWPFKYVLADDY